MNTDDSHKGGTITLVEAMEALSHIVEIDLEKSPELAQEDSFEEQEDSLTHRTVQWFQHHNSTETMPVVRDIFKVILKYLKTFYDNGYSELTKTKVIEEIKTIMVLVGEAARKLDRLTKIFHKAHAQSVTQLKEYCELQDFYRSHISRAIDDTMIGRWILELSKKGQAILDGSKKVRLRGEKSPSTDHVFIDLDAVKKDTEYELFFMRKEDGTRFFNPQLIRNIKLFSDFGGFFGQKVEFDPITSSEVNRSRVSHACAKQILKATRPIIDRFYRNAMKHKDMDVVSYVNKAIMALMMTANPSALYRDPLVKDSDNYFVDFQNYLRAALTTFDYQRIVVYSNTNPTSWSGILLDTIHSLCSALYIQTNGVGEVKNSLLNLVDQAHESISEGHAGSKGCWDKLAGDYAAMTKFLKGHSNGPINIVLDLIERGEDRGFDPLAQGNVPSVEYDIYVGEKRYIFARWPSPTVQRSINKATLSEEFKGFLRDGLADRLYKKCLLVNFQDRLTWKEYYRASALESLDHCKEFGSCVDVVTIAMDTEFYHQESPYKSCNHADVFIDQFLEQLKEGAGGYWFPADIVKKGKLNEFCKTSLEAIHRIFFSSKNTLTVQQKQDFIEIFNLFLIMKIIDVQKPDVIGLCCKDGIDLSPAVAAELYVLLKLLHQDVLKKEDMNQLTGIVYAPALHYRERLMLPDRFQRMSGAIRVFESTQRQFGRETFYKIINEAFGDLMKDPLYKGGIHDSSRS